MKYIKQLDAIRAIAVFLVILSHWIEPENEYLALWFGMLGPVGVNTFFVLSGFLISGILLKERLAVGAGVQTTWLVFRNFYIRRALRIFPVYYLLLVLILLFGETGKFEFVSYLTYTSNYFFYLIRDWASNGHLWSLAVEEQFYFIWPLVLLLVKRSYLFPVLILFIVTGITAQVLTRNDDFATILTPACFDAFGMGGLLAWTITMHPDRLNRMYKFVSVAGCIALIIFLGELVFDFWPNLPQRTIQSTCALWLISYVVKQSSEQRSHSHLLFRLLGNKALVFIGKISYGIYLYHLYIPAIRVFVVSKLPGSFAQYLNNPAGSVLLFTVDLAIVIGIALLSWKFIERPLLYFKGRFAASVPTNERESSNRGIMAGV
jgi:peptidoglycan/LPS O-acetylase OafA/YrhL